MAFKNFSDFIRLTQQELLPSDFLVGYREFNQEFRTRIDDLTLELIKKLDIEVAPEVLYVSPNGKDTNSGKSDFSAFRTIKRAAAKALELGYERRNKNLDNILPWGINFKQVNIFVRTGDYIEDNPVYLPPSTTVIGDNLRSTTFIPKNRFYDCFWVNNRCYVWGFTFRRHLAPAYAIAYPEFAKVNFEDRAAYPSTRVASATAKALSYYTEYPQLPLLYNATRLSIGEDLTNLSLDDQDSPPIFDPWKIAFLTRYFQNIPQSPLFNEEEIIDNADFTNSQWYNNNVRRPYQLTSPYTQGGSSITQATSAGANDAGGGVLVDGYQVDGPLRSMVMDSFTQFNEGGKGIHIINNGYAQLVSTFTICCTEGVMCETGGTCSINTSNCSFGLSGLVALGKSPKPTLIGRLKNPITGNTNTVQVRALSSRSFTERQEFPFDFQPYPGQVFIFVFGDDGNGNPLSATNDGSYFTALSCTKAVREDVVPGNDEITYESSLILETNYSPRFDTSINPNRNAPQVNEIPDGAEVYFFIRSTITTSAHTMEYIGTGTTLLSSVPQKGGQTDTATEAVFDAVGRVFFTSTNQFGDFRIGTGLTIVQATGTIEGETFERSILNIVTPFTIAIASSL